MHIISCTTCENLMPNHQLEMRLAPELFDFSKGDTDPSRNQKHQKHQNIAVS